MRRAWIWVLLIALASAGCRPRGGVVVVSVFFTKAEGPSSGVVEVARTVPQGDAPAMLRDALEAMLAGPTAAERAQGLVTSIPAGTRLRSVRVQDGIVRADFSREVEQGGGSASMLGRFWQIVYTATQFPAIPRVQILIEGQERQAMGGEGVIIEKPVSRPPSPPRF